jgi:hypothetical protein
LYGQAAMRTPAERSWFDTILNLVSFPFENFGHLFPTSIILLFAFRKGIFKKWLGNDFTAFVLITLAVNIVPYWLSPGYFPRYLFMLYPLVFLLSADAMMRFQKDSPRLNKFFEGFFLVVGSAVTVGFVAAFFVPEFYELPLFVPSVIFCIAIGSGILMLWFKWSQFRIYWSFAFLILFRLGFDLFVLPYRLEVEDSQPKYRKDQAQQIVALSGDKDLVMYSTTPLFMDYAFYMGVGKDAIIRKTTERLPNTVYLIDDARLENLDPPKVLYRFNSRFRENYLSLVEWPADTAKAN